MRKPRLKDIADSLGVSISTVSRALNGNTRISEDLRNAVLDKSKELNYQLPPLMRLNGNVKAVKIAVISQYNIFFKTVIEGMKAALSEFSPYDVTVDYKFNDLHDVVEQTKQLREILENDLYDGIVIAPAHPVMLNPLISELVGKGKLVITFNTDAPDSGRLQYIGQHSFTAGCIAGQLCGIQLRLGEDIAIVNSIAMTIGSKERTDGFVEYINSSFPHLKIIGQFQFADTIETAESIAEQIIIMNDNIRAIYSNNMVGTIGCARAVEKTGKSKSIFVIGFDSNEEIEHYINEGIIFSTILQEPFNQGYRAINILLKQLLFGKKVDQQCLYTKTDILMKSTLNLLKYNDKVII